MGNPDLARGDWRVGCAVLGSVLLHVAVITAWSSHRPPRQPTAQPAGQAMVLQWIAAVPAAQAESAQRTSADAIAKVVSARQAKAPAKMPPAPGRPALRAETRTGTPAKSPGQAVDGPPMQASIPTLSSEPDAALTDLAVTAPAPRRPASDSGADDVPLRWSAEAVGRADRQEREWQRRHGTVTASQLATDAGRATAAPPGAALTAREWRGSDGARVAQVHGPGGSRYCVRLPSANRLPEQGAAPRLANVSNCP